jgi:hypothetical protein
MAPHTPSLCGSARVRHRWRQTGASAKPRGSARRGMPDRWARSPPRKGAQSLAKSRKAVETSIRAKQGGLYLSNDISSPHTQEKRPVCYVLASCRVAGGGEPWSSPAALLLSRGPLVVVGAGSAGSARRECGPPGRMRLRRRCHQALIVSSVQSAPFGQRITTLLLLPVAGTVLAALPRAAARAAAPSPCPTRDGRRAGPGDGRCGCSPGRDRASARRSGPGPGR